MRNFKYNRLELNLLKKFFKEKFTPTLEFENAYLLYVGTVSREKYIGTFSKFFSLYYTFIQKMYEFMLETNLYNIINYIDNCILDISLSQGKFLNNVNEILMDLNKKITRYLNEYYILMNKLSSGDNEDMTNITKIILELLEFNKLDIEPVHLSCEEIKVVKDFLSPKYEEFRTIVEKIFFNSERPCLISDKNSFISALNFETFIDVLSGKKNIIIFN